MPLLPYLQRDWRIWEPACGEGNLVRGLQAHGLETIGTDLLGGRDFFCWQPERWDASATNPPFSRKDECLERCVALGKPWALLLPYTTLESRRRRRVLGALGERLEIVFLDGRPKFTTPNGNVGGSWFPVAWFCCDLAIGRQLVLPGPAPGLQNGRFADQQILQS